MLENCRYDDLPLCIRYNTLTSKTSNPRCSCQSVAISRQRSCHCCSWNCVRSAKELVSNTSGLTQAAQECSVDRGWVVADGVLAGKEDPRQTGGARCGWGTCSCCWRLLGQRHRRCHHFIVASYHSNEHTRTCYVHVLALPLVNAHCEQTHRM